MPRRAWVLGGDNTSVHNQDQSAIPPNAALVPLFREGRHASVLLGRPPVC